MHQRSITQSLVICLNIVLPSTVVRDLGVWIDSCLTMSLDITKVVTGCYAVLRELRGVRKSLSRELLTSLVVALVLIRLDYCSAVLAGLSNAQLDRLIFSVHRRDLVTAAPATSTRAPRLQAMRARVSLPKQHHPGLSGQRLSTGVRRRSNQGRGSALPKQLVFSS
jgi:hypothetical protein